MDIRGGVGARLREERERLDKNQETFGAIASIGRKTQAAYEADVNSPTIAYLADISRAGVDVFYILTGYRNSEALAPEEGELVGKFRSLAQDRQQLVSELCNALGDIEYQVSAPVAGPGRNFSAD